MMILEEIQRDAKITDTDLALWVHLAPSPCLVGVRSLEQSGVISRHVALLGHLAGAAHCEFSKIDQMVKDAEGWRPSLKLSSGEGARMHDLERNKAAAKRYFELLSAGDIKGLDALLADDLDYWVLGNLPNISGSHKKPDLFAMIPPFMEMWDGPLVFTITSSIAEENRVALEVRNKGRTKSGKKYENAYHIAFELRDGRITRIREYFDTIHFRDTIP